MDFGKYGSAIDDMMAGFAVSSITECHRNGRNKSHEQKKIVVEICNDARCRENVIFGDIKQKIGKIRHAASVVVLKPLHHKNQTRILENLNLS